MTMGDNEEAAKEATSGGQWLISNVKPEGGF
jgi:hypothetical protein